MSTRTPSVSRRERRRRRRHSIYAGVSVAFMTFVVVAFMTYWFLIELSAR